MVFFISIFFSETLWAKSNEGFTIIIQCIKLNNITNFDSQNIFLIILNKTKLIH